MKQRSTCRWCKRPIQRLTEGDWWKSNFGLDNTGSGDHECDAAPNPDEGPMPAHQPGTAVMNQDGTIAYYPAAGNVTDGQGGTAFHGAC